MDFFSSKKNTLSSPIKYSKPLIIAFDLPFEATSKIQSNGYSVSTGSFGNPYTVSPNHPWDFLTPNGQLPPHYAEGEIIVINLDDKITASPPKQETVPQNGPWVASTKNKWVDPSPMEMHHLSSDLLNILDHNGIFIIFANKRINQELFLFHGQTRTDDISSRDNWCFLSLLANYFLDIKSVLGKEIFLHGNSAFPQIRKVLAAHIDGAEYRCTFADTEHPEYPKINPIALNKFQEPVAVSISRAKKKDKIFLFPQIKDKGSFLVDLLNNALPEISPQLFPCHEKISWTENVLYEIPEILEVHRVIDRTRQKAEEDIAALREKVTLIRKDKSYLHDLITQTGTPLVDAVIKALITLGFNAKEIQDMDTLGGEKNEDIRIDDERGLLLIEIKGINNTPADEDALQVAKYIAPLQKELQRLDIIGITLINHQRKTPPLDRENENTFRPTIIENALKQHIGLMTTWFLFKLCKSFMQNKWTHQQIRPTFFQSSLITYPCHYVPIGKIEKIFPEKSSIGCTLENEAVDLSDKIAVEFPDKWVEFNLTSIQVDGKSSNNANIGNQAGFQINIEGLKNGMRLYKIRH